MQGIQFVTNDKGKKIAVMIDLRKYGEIWEDFYDSPSGCRVDRGFKRVYFQHANF